MNTKSNILPICYRCDNKYKYFLINSVKSLLKHYKGEHKIHFYICTTETDFNLDELQCLQQKYSFYYEIVKFDDDFIRQHSLQHCATILNKKILNFWNQSHWLHTNKYNHTTFPYNPFNRNKLICCCSIFFLATIHHEKVLCLDTDTIIVDDVSILFSTDVSNVIMAVSEDWEIEKTINPSVVVTNTVKCREIAFKKNGLIDTMLLYMKNPNNFAAPFADVIQEKMHQMVIDSHLVLDRAWNVPVTHLKRYDNVQPKIYHFCESWNGIPEVLNKYEEIVGIYLKNE